MLEKNVLFLVTGMTPSIITETIWALACDPDLDESTRWVPDEVQVLSTEHGLDQIRSRLLNDKVFAQFKKDYPLLADVKFDESSLYSIKDEQGNALADLRTPEDNECAADMINEHIRQLAQSNNTVLHVSIAGGRKTMGFYAGYALSLHGRAQDRMSHVLVDQSYENVPDFFYPTPNAFYVKDRDNRAWDASKAQVWLAEIPFVRMQDAIKERHSIKDDSFMSTVHKINEASNDVKISIDVMGRTVRINDKYVIDDLPPREFAVLWWFADLRRNNKPGIITPTGNMNSKNLAASVTITKEQAKEYFEQNTDKFQQAEAYHVRHIFLAAATDETAGEDPKVRAERQAKTINEINAGLKDGVAFEKLAQKHSEERSTGD